jgi:glutamate-1-semialdehyde 2,1-aminomutase
MYQAGTLSGNPLTMAAGITTLRELSKPAVWDAIERRAAQLCDGLAAAALAAGVPAVVQRVGTMFTTFFTDRPVRDWSSARLANTPAYAAYFRAMLEAGVYLAPSQFEAGFLSTQHQEEEIQMTLRAAAGALQKIRD